MATIALYADKVNQMPGLIGDVKRSVMDFKAELAALKNKSLKIDQSICDMEDVVSSIQASTQIQEEAEDSLDAFREDTEQFVEEAARIDREAADVIRQRKDEFYDQYYYLKPECEKGDWEKFCDGCKKAWEWCREHWRIIVTVVLVVVAVVLMYTGVGGPLGGVILWMCEGILTGAVVGGTLGGLSGIAAGGSFFEGFERGAFSGVLMGIFFGGLGGVGEMLGSSCAFLEVLGPAVKAVPVISRALTGISLGMAGFDLLSLGVSLFDRNDWLVQMNRKLHSSTAYNTFQSAVSILAVFSGGFVKGMRNPTCFVAGTPVLTAAGLVAIEGIRAGDRVISTDPATGETAEKEVVKTYIRKADRLVHLTVSSEELITTVDHPFYVKEYGFTSAGGLCVGDRLVDAGGNVLAVEAISQELVGELVTVYNFQVEGFHTYYAGVLSVLVHNANYPEDVGGMQEQAISGKEGAGEPLKGGSEPDFYVGPNGKALPSQYKDWIGTNIQKELLDQAENPQLQNAIKQLYRGNSFIGDGGTADIIRFEQQTGLMLGKYGGSHVQKGIDMAKYILNKILTQDLSPSDRALATQLLEDLYNALGR